MPRGITVAGRGSQVLPHRTAPQRFGPCDRARNVGFPRKMDVAIKSRAQQNPVASDCGCYSDLRQVPPACCLVAAPSLRNGSLLTEMSRNRPSNVAAVYGAHVLLRDSQEAMCNARIVHILADDPANVIDSNSVR